MPIPRLPAAARRPIRAMDLSVWLAYLVATIILSVSPGPGVFSSLAAGLNHGFRRGMWNAVGMQVANLTLMAFVSVGLGAILLASESLFTAVKWAGVVYLIWLGLVTWRSEPHKFDERADAPQGKDSREVFLKGFFVNITNPKGIIFYAAVLPQFIDVARPQFVQYAILGLTTLVVDLVVMAGYIGLAARVLAVMKDPAHLRWVNHILGGAFVAAGLALAAFRRGHAAAP